MEFNINTNLIPIEIGVPHRRDNWKTPESDKFNDGYDYLSALKMDGFYECYFDYKSQEFTAQSGSCRALTFDQIDVITNKLNSL